MNNKSLLLTLKLVMCTGIAFILIGIYLHNFSDTMEDLGVTGIIVSAAFVAIGMIMSIPTKMYLTFIWVKREADATSSHSKRTS
ncbi:hypothetical protein DRW07_03115 [Alteromonas sediminis]|uniref:Uncharacterized protein n=1 Tax=Alteromonas sediminis TaxID=2259342 RepID=A0A3N5Y592_9ALTE|nr:hypothetical protein [Alteromonas sediminis]RPJ68413.1 hypothetical protein DRW07_03115 [Alteromonas sediminis]